MPEFFYADRLFNGLERGEPAPGMLLLAAPGMLSPEFARTVVLIVDHGIDSTLGVILNSRSEIAVHNAMPEWVDLVAAPQAMYRGGPVGATSMVGIGVTSSGVLIDDQPVLTRLANRLAQVDLRAEPQEVAPAVDSMRLFLGYAEWAPGQLDEEIERGDWFIAPALPSDVVAPAAADLWGDVMRRQAMPLPLYATFPANLDDN
ncbi:YqgE/AlgH family protein [Corynebacterium sanguinis]|uniref:YqgE/AlgH family protein n=1 Tax=Corynebacterium sanguinis TaxID=2594913 RepID=A0A838WYB7_9CORY|nr:YqgE/AlgH family protein [Corynebacterium sanguinis]MBA4505735.1 YqgE/AlgH family protein [Corynebacterium sanguinis]